VANSYVNDIKDFLKENDIVKVKILNMEPGGKIGLSIRQAMAQPPPTTDNNFGSEHTQQDNTFEEKLARFMKDSNEKLIALKKHQEGKKGR
jgi:S1 RNA binding domain protein